MRNFYKSFNVNLVAHNLSALWPSVPKAHVNERDHVSVNRDIEVYLLVLEVDTFLIVVFTVVSENLDGFVDLD